MTINRSQGTKNTLLQFAQGNRTNQKLQECIFSHTCPRRFTTKRHDDELPHRQTRSILSLEQTNWTYGKTDTLHPDSPNHRQSENRIINFEASKRQALERTYDVESPRIDVVLPLFRCQLLV